MSKWHFDRLEVYFGKIKVKTCSHSLFRFGITLSSMLWKTMNSDGTTKSNPAVPRSIPPTVPTPTDTFPLAPTPYENIRGNMPKIIVMEVIRMGRRRALAADKAAVVMLMP